jgi:uncharacterized protein with PIN domain
MESPPEPRFACDAMLGGLARWLRAAGYDAWWSADVDDPDLVRLAAAEGRTLLSSDTGIFRYRVVRDGAVAALEVPRHLATHDQLAFVLGRLSLPLRESRCMACGGRLVEADRESVRGEVPPRSFAWVERFWRCDRCGQVFWHGTHWPRIVERLRQAAAKAR